MENIKTLKRWNFWCALFVACVFCVSAIYAEPVYSVLGTSMEAAPGGTVDPNTIPKY